MDQLIVMRELEGLSRLFVLKIKKDVAEAICLPGEGWCAWLDSNRHGVSPEEF